MVCLKGTNTKKNVIWSDVQNVGDEEYDANAIPQENLSYIPIIIVYVPDVESFTQRCL